MHSLMVQVTFASREIKNKEIQINIRLAILLDFETL